MGDRLRVLTDLGYERLIVTRCSRAIDELLPTMMRRQAMDAVSILESIRELKDGIFVLETHEILAESSDCFCAVWMRLKKGEMIVAVPWLAQYEQGACLSVYRKGEVDDYEMELILSQLIERLELVSAPNAQIYVM